MLRVKRQLIFFIALVGLIIAAFFWQTRLEESYLDKPYVRQEVALDTLVTIKAYGKDKQQVKRGVNKAFAKINQIDKLMNYYSASSEVTKINKKAGKAEVKVSPETIEAIFTSKQQTKKTNGAFDITVGPIMDLWGFGQKDHIPSEEELAQVLPLVNSSLIRINKDRGTVALAKEKMKIDLGAVAKGYAADEAIRVLKKYHISHALVTTGSTTRLLNSKPNQKEWKIGIQHPRKKDKTIGLLSLSNVSISTSGDYQQYFVRGKKRYHHILNPKTGLPTRGVMSVTVVTSKSCAEADILSTALFVMGYNKGIRYIENTEGLEGVIITSNGKIHVSSGLKGKIKDLKGKI